jgi:hypothetical protein
MTRLLATYIFPALAKAHAAEPTMGRVDDELPPIREGAWTAWAAQSTEASASPFGERVAAGAEGTFQTGGLASMPPSPAHS